MYRRTQSKYRSRNHYREEIASAKRDKPKKPKVEPTPEYLALLACDKEIRQMRLRGEKVPAELHKRYNELLKAHQATLKK